MQPNQPTVILRQSTPSPLHHNSPMIAQQQFSGGFWPNMGADFLSAVPRNIQDPRYHKRGSSGSSVASTGPASPHQTNTYHPRIASSDADYSPSRFEYEYPQSAKTVYSMPDQILFPGSSNFGGAVDMRRIQSLGNDDGASYGPQSVSTMSHQNSPATPQTWEDSYHDEKNRSGNFQSAAYQHALQEVFPDQHMQMTYPNKVSNHRHTLQEQFSKSQQQYLRTGSPTSNPRDRSPFKVGSSEMQSVQRQPRPIPQLQTQRTSISPKELMLDEHGLDNKPSLFPDQATFNRQPSNFSNFYASFNQQPSLQIPQHYPFVSQTNTNDAPDSTPDFPAHMPTMESTNEEGLSEPSSQQSQLSVRSRQPLTRPDVSSDAGTYSCTYHGCPLRFDTPAKLQKHKREGHRQIETAGATAAAVAAAAKNTQAGPHRCDRINPITGKPCSSIFSRPYDLTRHEDTIHNARKLKVRCHLCTEEKTFSRNDALTRHMRVVHPDVDWIGKQKKRVQK